MTIFPSCPESFEEAEEYGQEFREQHQKVHELRGGDIITIPAGVGYWYYNNGNTTLVTVILLDTSSFSNQLDRNPRVRLTKENTNFRHYVFTCTYDNDTACLVSSV